jgi:hypothetical protein
MRIVVGVLALLIIGLPLSVMLFAKSPAPGTGPLSKLTACLSGSVWLARSSCDRSGCDDTPGDTVYLNWTDGKFTTGTSYAEAFPLDAKDGVALLAELSAVSPTPKDPRWLASAVLREDFVAGGTCDENFIEMTSFPRLDLLATLRAGELEDAPRALMLTVRGPGPRAERLHARLRRLAR